MFAIEDLYCQVVSIATCAPFETKAGLCEQQWAERFTVDARKQVFLSIWGYVRVELAKRLNLPEQALVFARTKTGKPYLAAPDAAQSMRFNLTHTKDFVGFCCSQQVVACGIDIEIPRQMTDMLAIAERFYAPAEFAVLQSLNANQQLDYFFKLWVIKEAVLKASGHGIVFGLDKVLLADVLAQDQGSVTLHENAQTVIYHWYFDAAPNQPYVKAVALRV